MVLALRDAYAYPSETSPSGAVLDSIVAGVCVLMSQALMALAAPSLALESSTLANVVAISLLGGVAGARCASIDEPHGIAGRSSAGFWNRLGSWM